MNNIHQKRTNKQEKLKKDFFSCRLPYQNKKLPLINRVTNFLEIELACGKPFRGSAATLCAILKTKCSSYMSGILRKLRDNDHRFNVSKAERRPKSPLYYTLWIEFSPLYKQLQHDKPHGINILKRSDSILILQPSVSRGHLTKEIVTKLSLNLDQQAKLEAYPTWVLQKAWYQMRKYLYVGKRFYCSAWNYFNTILDVLSGAKRLTLKKQQECVASFALYYQKLVCFAREKMLKKEHESKITRLVCNQEPLPTEHLYWSDYEYDYGQ